MGDGVKRELIYHKFKLLNILVILKQSEMAYKKTTKKILSPNAHQLKTFYTDV